MSEKMIPIWNSDGSCAEESENKTFCMAPWSHTYISPQGERRMCCASREEHTFQKQYIDSTNDPKYGNVKDSKTDADDFNPSTLEEHWNSAYMKDIRKKLMAGERISQCDVCNDDTLSLSSYRKWFTGVLFKDKIQEAFDKTDDDGHTEMPVISFDYRYSNLCNFKCRMCGEQLSSAWEAEKKKHDMWTVEHQPFMQPTVKQKMQKFQKDVAEPEFKKAISDGLVEEIYWVGGEPLMYDMHWWALEEMVNNGSAKNCYLRYNSNLSRVDFKGKNLFDYLPQFKDWLMCASIDGTGDIVEFIRKGIVWEEWLKDLFDLSLELDVRIETKIMFAFHADIVMSPFAWPRHILDRKIDELLDYMIPLKTNKQDPLINTLIEMKKRPTFAEQFPDTHEHEFKNGKGYQDRLDEIRQEQYRLEDIYELDTELYNWWKRNDG